MRRGNFGSAQSPQNKSVQGIEKSPWFGHSDKQKWRSIARRRNYLCISAHRGYFPNKETVFSIPTNILAAKYVGLFETVEFSFRQLVSVNDRSDDLLRTGNTERWGNIIRTPGYYRVLLTVFTKFNALRTSYIHNISNRSVWRHLYQVKIFLSPYDISVLGIWSSSKANRLGQSIYVTLLLRFSRHNSQEQQKHTFSSLLYITICMVCQERIHNM
jgi:hypothetical protein